MKNLNKIAGIFFSIGLIFIVLGASCAFFMYYQSGLYSYAINGGKINVIFDETTGNNISMENAFPMTDNDALTKSLEFEFTITGYNESEKNVYYAIEIEYGEDVVGKTRFNDKVINLSLEENTKTVMKNQVFDSLDNQGIYYGYIESGTSNSSPTINNYVLNIWINDNVYITNSIPNDSDEWGDDELEWAYQLFDGDIGAIENGEVRYLSDLGYYVYRTEEYQNYYASFKINVRANLMGEDIGALLYNANGGTNTPKQTSLLTNQITKQKPVITNKGFLGWSEDKDATIPEYKAGDYYSGNAKILYAVYGDTRNVMGTFPTIITDLKESISEVYFINDSQESIDARYDAATIKADLTYNGQGNVKGWLEVDSLDNTKYIIYVGSEETIYLTDCYGMFYGWHNTKVVDFSNADTSQVTDMSYMFAASNENDGYIARTNYGFKNSNYELLMNSDDRKGKITRVFDSPGTDSFMSLEKVDEIVLNTTNVTTVSYMFSSCNRLTSLDVSNFDTSSVTNMRYMFNYCERLTSLDITNFDTSSVMDMSHMFYNCSILTSLYVSNFDVSSVVDMSRMFYYCRSLTNLDVSNFDTSSVTDMASMFIGCSSLENLDISNFDTSFVIDMSWMFYGCSNLISLDVSGFDTSSVTNMDSMFDGCNKLTRLDVSNFDTSFVTDMGDMFRRCISLTNLDVSGFETSSVTNMFRMFSLCDSLTSLDLSNFNTSSVTDMSNMFSECGSLTSLDLSNFNTSSVTDMSNMFSECGSLTNLDISNFDTSSVTDMRSMFSNCSSITSLDISNFIFNTVESYYNVFYCMPSTAIVTVNTVTEQSWILGLSSSYRPSTWNTTNVVIKSA